MSILKNSAFTRTLISPPTAKAPKIRVNLKTIHITLPEDLDSKHNLHHKFW
ncbi:MAG: hypothetical protein M9931_12335 [Chitinophagales bacterium]|nr:hypothetical protein [Chitinophagales bacterium]